MSTLVPLMLVPLLVWVAVWGYLCSLDAKIKRLQHELRQGDETEEEI